MGATYIYIEPITVGDITLTFFDEVYPDGGRIAAVINAATGEIREQMVGRVPQGPRWRDTVAKRIARSNETPAPLELLHRVRMNDAPIDEAVDEAVDEAFPQVAWDRERPGRRTDIASRYSVQHRAPLNASRTLCGASIPWDYVQAGDSRRCRRCDAIARGRVTR